MPVAWAWFGWIYIFRRLLGKWIDPVSVRIGGQGKNSWEGEFLSFHDHNSSIIMPPLPVFIYSKNPIF